ncbi:MAG: hypothetical protein H0S80_10705 [Desulfovibrionaceae bacterium]|nr:hypothetical protein [Desulfovibrionaceae bacterium]
MKKLTLQPSLGANSGTIVEKVTRIVICENVKEEYYPLFLAAPDMLEALEECVAMMDTPPDSALKAIEKATTPTNFAIT